MKKTASEEPKKKKPAKAEKPVANETLFQLESTYQPSGDQPKAIAELVANFKSGLNHQTLLGVTGSGKTYTMAHVIAQMNRPALILAHNKTLAAQLYAEFKELFPKNAVEYFVSYYDYYQPEAYLPSSDTFIEKDSAINDQIDRMRHSATHSMFDRRDVIIISSVSCIYGLGSPEAYQSMTVYLERNKEMKRDHLLRELVRLQYPRSDIDFHRGTFRVRGDVVDIFPAYEDQNVIRVEFFGDYIDRLMWMDPITGEIVQEMDKITVYPASHHVATEETKKRAIITIQEELRERLAQLSSEMRLIEAKRLEQRTYYDIEMIEEMGYCQGIENYSRHFTGHAPGQPPPTLLEYFPKDFIAFIDESHVTIPQVGGMYRGDRSRKMTLVEHGFRLPSALDNRPLNFQEFEKCLNKTVYVSATPSTYELEKSQGLIIEQVIRPTGLLDPNVEVRPVKNQIGDILKEIKIRTDKKQRVLITTLTKKSAEDLTDYLDSQGIAVKYLHSDIKTVERMEIIKDLRLGVFDVLIGINLLREGLDIPEVSLVAITDADKEGFLRSERSLIQTIGRAARNSDGHVILYADRITDSMKKAMSETARRRAIQLAYNTEHGITPTTIKKSIPKGLMEIYEKVQGGPSVAAMDKLMRFPEKISEEVERLKKKMKQASAQLEFEEAAKYRDEVRRLQLMQLELTDEALPSDQ
jgi:excinuclease ABC subunit B